jgi:hypothetical protein
MIFEGIYNHNAIRKYGGEKKELSNVKNRSCAALVLLFKSVFLFISFSPDRKENIIT